MEKICKECGDKFSGRSDAKYCSDHCRSAFNNKTHRSSDTYVRKVNAILKKNRRILANLNPKGKTRVKLADLVKHGLDQSYLTNTYTTKAGKVYKFCYDQGYLDTGDGWCTLVTKHDYV